MDLTNGWTNWRRDKKQGKRDEWMDKKPDLSRTIWSITPAFCQTGFAMESQELKEFSFWTAFKAKQITFFKKNTKHPILRPFFYKKKLHPKNQKKRLSHNSEENS